MDTLAAKGLLDDARFAHWWAEDRALTGKWGPLRVREELEAKGLDRELIDAALKESFPLGKQRDILAALTRKGKSPAGRGFDPDLVEEFLDPDATL